MKLILTPGMGIGPEVTARALKTLNLDAAITLMGDAEAICAALDEADVPYQKTDDAPCSCAGICVVHCGSEGEPPAVAAIRLAAEACLEGRADALVTGPIHKARLIQQGFAFLGHTDMLGAICGVDPVMAFAGGTIRVALVTTHLPLKDVPASITAERVERVVRTANRALQRDLCIANPRLAVCGLNPHAGEEGVLGSTEKDVIDPVVRLMRSEGMRVTGPISAETAFMDAHAGQYDLVVAMYHDQGLVPLKVLDFGRSVNWTLGLPILRTSVDHGTADTLVGTGKADPSSMRSAIDMAVRILRNRS